MLLLYSLAGAAQHCRHGGTQELFTKVGYDPKLGRPGAKRRGKFRVHRAVSHRDPFVYETPCFQWAQCGRGLESLVEEPRQDVPEPKPKPKPKGIMSWFGAHAARRVR
jgi:hypothetical protein